MSHLDNESSQEKLIYKLELAYIGSDFCGWQSQPSGESVQDHIERGLGILLRKKTRIIGASRTDTGVHAEHQVAIFKTDKKIKDVLKFRRSLNALIPKSVAVHVLESVSSDFHPIYSAKAKLYRYRIWSGDSLSPFVRPYVWHLPAKLSIAPMVEASQYLIGSHNFKSFCASDSSVSTFERKIIDVRWKEHKNLIEFFVLGEGFLKQMVRNLVGTLVEVGAGKRTVESVNELILLKNRTLAGRTAPPEGLSLVQIYYDQKEDISESDCSSYTFGFNLGPV